MIVEFIHTLGGSLALACKAHLTGTPPEVDWIKTELPGGEEFLVDGIAIDGTDLFDTLCAEALRHA